MLTLLGSGQGQNTTSLKIGVYVTSSMSLIYQSDSIDSIMTFLNSYTTAVPITIQFNDSSVHQPSGGVINISTSLVNGSNLVTFKAKTGTSPTIDGQLINNQVVIIGISNCVWDGINVKNALVVSTDTGGTIMRLNGNQSNITIKNVTLTRGFCGIRGTTNINGITLQNIVVQEVWGGAIRVGNGSFTGTKLEDFDLRLQTDFDIQNVTISNITGVDTLSGGVVPGTTQYLSFVVLVKMCYNLSVTTINVGAGRGAQVAIESSYNVLLDKLNLVDYSPGTAAATGISVINTDVLILANSFARRNSSATAGSTLIYLNVVRNLSLIHNTFIALNANDTTNISYIRRVIKMVGNIFSGINNTALTITFATTINGVASSYTPSVANDLLEEHDNIFASPGTYNTNLTYSKLLGGTDLSVRNNSGTNIVTPATYRSTYTGLGVNSLFPLDTALILGTRVNPDLTTSLVDYLSDSSVGRNAITASLDTHAAKDLFGFTRTYSTDMGATDKDAIV